MKMPTWLIATITGIGVAVTGIIGLFVKSKIDEKKVTDANKTLGKSEVIKEEIDVAVKTVDEHIDEIKATHEENNSVISDAEVKKEAIAKVAIAATMVAATHGKKVETKREKLARKKKELADRRKAISAKKNSL